MSWFRKSRRGDSGGAAAIRTENVVDSVMNPTSYSLVLFEGSHGAAIPSLLTECGYEIRRQGASVGTPVELMDGLRVIGSDPSIVLKAFYSTPEVTVLVEPEMVLLALNRDQLEEFCRVNDTRCAAAVWERVSETAMLLEIDGSGLTHLTWYQSGSPVDDQVDPRPEVASEPDGQGVRAALEAAGWPVDLVFDPATVTVLEIQE